MHGTKEAMTGRPVSSKAILWRRRALLAVVAAIAGLLTVEAIAWVLIGPPHAGHHRIFCTWDPDIGWRLKPNTTARHNTREYDIIEHINALGLRGPATSYAKPSGTYRTLLLGDSFFEGYTVADDAVVSERLQDDLPRIGPGRHEVINGGVGGYSTDQELVWFRKFGRRFRPDATVLGFFLNDVWFNTQPRYLRGPKPMFPLHGGRLARKMVPPKPIKPREPVRGIHRISSNLAEISHVYRRLRQRWWRYKFAPKPGRPSPAQAPSLHDRPESPAVKAAWQATELLLVRVAAEVRATGSRFAVLYVPARQHVEGGRNRRERDHDAIRARLAGICKRRAIPFLDPTAALLERSRQLAGADFVYFPKDGHWTAAGHDVAAEVIAEWLRARPRSGRASKLPAAVSATTP